MLRSTLKCPGLGVNSQISQGNRTVGGIPLPAAGFVSHNTFMLEFDNETSTPRKQRLAAFICACLKRRPKGASYYARRLRLRAHPQIRPTTASPHCESAATHHPRRLPPRPLRLAWLPYVPRTALCPVVQLEVAWLASIAANAVEVLGIFLA